MKEVTPQVWSQVANVLSKLIRHASWTPNPGNILGRRRKGLVCCIQLWSGDMDEEPQQVISTD